VKLGMEIIPLLFGVLLSISWNQ